MNAVQMQIKGDQNHRTAVETVCIRAKVQRATKRWLNKDTDKLQQEHRKHNVHSARNKEPEGTKRQTNKQTVDRRNE